MQIIEQVSWDNCTGCGSCENTCPVKAIYMRENKEGFWYPFIDKRKCVQCDQCLSVCPVLKNEEKNYDKKKAFPTKIYAAWSLDQTTRYHSTSGGIFSELALFVLKKGGYVCGAVYDKEQSVRHFITDKENDLGKLRQSKYVQSEIGDIYKQIGDLLQKKRTVLFCGTPCQCAGIINYCNEKRIETSNLYLIDFICRGVNSPKVYRKFLDELEKRYKSDISRVWFKNKTYGWNRFSTRIEFENGRKYLQDRYHDTYIRGYIEENLFIRPSCANCKFKGFHRVADITLADFWGVQLEREYMNETDGGTSMVMLHTARGKQLLDFISHNIYKVEKELSDVILGNVCFEHSIRHSMYRKQFMDDLDDMPVIENIERFLNTNS